MRKIYLVLIAVFAVTTLHAQVNLVKDIRTGADGSNPGYYGMLESNGEIFFTSFDGGEAGGGANGSELWKTDGTEAGTVLVKDILPGTASSFPTFYFKYNDVVYFSASSDDNGFHPWKTDGTETGTVKVNDGPAIFSPVELDGILYYRHHADFKTKAKQLYTFDGSSSAPVPNTGVNVAANEEKVYDMVAFDGKIFMYMENADTTDLGVELYSYDPAIDQFNLVMEIDTGKGDASISNFTVLGDKLYFEAENYLWVTDGTAVGTMQIDMNGLNIKWVKALYAWNGKLYFEGDDQDPEVSVGDQLYVYDPMAGTTMAISNVIGDHDPMYYTPLGDYLYYRGEPTENTSGYLFRTDGNNVQQVDTTVTITTLNSTTYSWNGMVVLDDAIFFDGTSSDTGKELFALNPPKDVSPVDKVSFDESSKGLSVYPNPSYGMITVQGLKFTAASYEIFDLSGKSVERGAIDGYKINYSLNKGIYLLQIIDGSISTLMKIVVR